METKQQSIRWQDMVETPAQPTSIIPTAQAGAVQEQPTVRQVLIAYKIIRVRNGRFYSLVDNKGKGKTVEYVIGHPLRELARPDHGGGFYVHVANNVMHIVERFKAGDLWDPIDIRQEYGVIECEVAPPFVFYDYDGNSIDPRSDLARLKKISVSHLLPTRFHGSFKIERPYAVPSQPQPIAAVAGTKLAPGMRPGETYAQFNQRRFINDHAGRNW